MDTNLDTQPHAGDTSDGPGALPASSAPGSRSGLGNSGGSPGRPGAARRGAAVEVGGGAPGWVLAPSRRATSGPDAPQAIDLALLQPAMTAGARRVGAINGHRSALPAPRPPAPGRPATPTEALGERSGVSVRSSLAFSRKSAPSAHLVPRTLRRVASA